MDPRDFSIPSTHRGDIKPLIPKDQWEKAREEAHQVALENGFNLESFTEWTGLDLVYDYYRLNVGHELAFPDVGSLRMEQYALLHTLFRQGNASPADGVEASDLNHVAARLGNIFHILDIFTGGYPSVNFTVNLQTGEVSRVED